MGRIKTTLVKRSTRKLVKEHGEKLTKNFKDNKKVLNSVASVTSKKLRNIIAGYATRLMRKKEE